MFRSLLNALKSRSARKPARRPPRRASVCRPRAEVLEDRCLLSFVPAGDIGTRGRYPSDVRIGYVDADANLDLVVTSFTFYEPGAEESGVEYRDALLGSGSGGFANQWLDYTDWPTGSYVEPDFNRDGIADQFIIDYGIHSPGDPLYVGSSVSVQLGDGVGGFGAPQRVWSWNTEYFGMTVAAAGDLNADGFTDLAIPRSEGGYGYVTILLNDVHWPPLPPPISAVRIGDMAVTEGHTGTRAAAFTVSLSIASSQPVTVDYATASGTAAAGTDYQPVAGTLTFAPGETTKTITIEVKGDSKREYDEYFFVDLSGNSSNSLFTKNYGVGTILNDD